MLHFDIPRRYIASYSKKNYVFEFDSVLDFSTQQVSFVFLKWMEAFDLLISQGIIEEEFFFENQLKHMVGFQVELKYFIDLMHFYQDLLS